MTNIIQYPISFDTQLRLMRLEEISSLSPKDIEIEKHLSEIREVFWTRYTRPSLDFGNLNVLFLVQNFILNYEFIDNKWVI